MPSVPIPTPGRLPALPEYDGVLLSHGDRSPFTSESFAAPGPVHGTVLLGGFVCGTWPGTSHAAVTPHRSRTVEPEAEGLRLLRFLVPTSATPASG